MMAPAALAKRAAALVVGRWVGLGLLAVLLGTEAGRLPTPLLVGVLAAGLLVALLNRRQRALLRSGAAPAAVRRTGRMLLVMDAVLLLLAARALATNEGSGYWALLGWIVVETAITEGRLATLASAAVTLGGMVLVDAMRQGALPSLAPGSGTFARVLTMAGAIGVVIAAERAMAREEQVAEERKNKLAALVVRERQALMDVQAFSNVVLSGVSNHGNLEGALESMTKRVAGVLNYERIALFLYEEGGKLRCRSWWGDWWEPPSTSFPTGPESIVGMVAASGEGMLILHPTRPAGGFPGNPDARSALCAPLRLADHVLGVVYVESPRPNVFSHVDLERLQRLADQMAIVIENARLFEAQKALARREKASREEIEAVSRAIVAAGEADTYGQKLDRMLAALAERLGYRALAYYQESEEREGRLQIRGAAGLPDAWLTVALPPDDQRALLASNVLATGEPQVATAEGVLRLAVPVRVGERTLGVLSAWIERVDAACDEEQRRLARIADQLALFIDQARLAQAEKATLLKLYELDRMKDDFVAMTSHELRTPLTVISGFVRTLLRPDLRLDGAQHRHFMEIIDRQTARLARLVEDLLLVSRIESGNLDVALGVYDPGRLLHEYAEEWSVEPGQLQLQVDPDLPLVRTDPDRLSQILRNLVDNAVRHGEGSPVSVRACRDGSDLVVQVQDRGPGIPPEELPHIFERFRQASSSRQRRSGLGLGLYITQQLVRALGGSIEASSAPGQGATFTIRFPGLPQQRP